MSRDRMRAMVLKRIGEPLSFEMVPIPEPKERDILIKVTACGLCRTDLHVVDGELTEAVLPLIPGHQIVGKIVKVGDKAKKQAPGLAEGMTVGVPWLGGACGDCEFCNNAQENLCDSAIYTGYQKNGGYAEYCTADFEYVFPIPQGYPDLQAAPLLCAGLIGYRSYRMAGDAKRIGFYGFGNAAHILIQVAKQDGRQIYAFTRKGDLEGQTFARRLGAVWAGDSETNPPELLDAAIIFAPVGSLLPTSLTHVRKGGIVVCAGIYMTDIPSFPYSILWGERTVRSVANLTRNDGVEFFDVAPKAHVKTEVKKFKLEDANMALQALRDGDVSGALVLEI